jgi:phosphate transport system ATP-binding protein
MNRMNDTIDGCRVEGTMRYNGQNIYDKDTDVMALRKRIGMIFQKPNPFPMSIRDNITYGPKIHGINKPDELDEIVETSLKRAAIWGEVEDRLDQSALSLSG